MSRFTIPQQKDRLRSLLYRRRAEAAKSAKDDLGIRLASAVAGQLGDGIAGVVISAFLPIRTEIDTRPLIQSLCDSGATIVLPTIIENSPDLVFRTWAPGDPVSKGAFGVEEPVPEAEQRDPSVLVVPLLAFDRDGYRLGYGGGYYDRAIERLTSISRVRAVGVAYGAQEVVHVPREAHDARLDAIVTPGRTFEFESR